MIAEPTKAKTELRQISRRNNESAYSVVQRFIQIVVGNRVEGDKKIVERLHTIKSIECNKEEDSTNE